MGREDRLGLPGVPAGSGSPWSAFCRHPSHCRRSCPREALQAGSNHALPLPGDWTKHSLPLSVGMGMSRRDQYCPGMRRWSQ